MPELDLHRLVAHLEKLIEIARSTLFALTTALAFVAPPLVTGIATAWHTIFVLGEFSEKFGQQGTFNLSVTLQTAVWGITAVTFSITRGVLCFATRSSPPSTRVLLLSLLLGAMTSVLLLTNTFLRQLGESWFAVGPIAAMLIHLASRSAKTSASTA